MTEKWHRSGQELDQVTPQHFLSPNVSNFTGKMTRTKAEPTIPAGNSGELEGSMTGSISKQPGKARKAEKLNVQRFTEEDTPPQPQREEVMTSQKQQASLPILTSSQNVTRIGLTELSTPGGNSGQMRDQMTADLSKKTSGLNKWGKPIQPKKLTDCRMEVLQTFLMESVSGPNNFGQAGGEDWIQELIRHLKMRNHRTGDVSAFDVKHWLQLPRVITFRESIKEVASKWRSTAPVASEGRPQRNGLANTVNVSELTGDQKMYTDEDNTKQMPALLPRPTHCSGEVNNEESAAPLHKMMTRNDGDTVSSTEDPLPTQNVAQDQSESVGQLPGSSDFQSDSSGERPGASSTLFEPTQVKHQKRPGSQAENSKGKVLSQEQEENEKQIEISTKGFVITMPASPVARQLVIRPVEWNVWYRDRDAQEEMEDDDSSDVSDEEVPMEGREFADEEQLPVNPMGNEPTTDDDDDESGMPIAAGRNVPMDLSQ